MNRKDRRRNKVITDNLYLRDEFLFAFNHHKEGKIKKAEQLYKKLLNKNSKHFEALRHLGIIYQDLHKLDKAFNFFEQAQEINPNSFEIYNNLGSILFQKFRFIESKNLLEKSLSINPNYLPALNNLTLLCHRENYAERALELSSKTINLAPNNLLVKSNYALSLSINNQLDKAIKIFKEVAQSQPTGPNYKNLGTSYRDSGQLKKSLDSFLTAMNHSPEDESIFFNLSASKLFQPTQDILDKFENILNTNKNLDLNQKTGIGFALYNSYKKLKNYKKSGEFLVKGNDFSDEWIKSDFQKEIRFINVIKDLFEIDFIKERASKKDLQKEINVKPIFIIGMPRSGTTLCEQILSSHSQITGGGELPHIMRSSGSVGAYNLDDSQIKDFKKIMEETEFNISERKARDYINRLKKIRTNDGFVTDKMPHNFIFVGFIKMIIPNAKIIYCKRNPLDNCFSLYAHKFIDMNHGYSYNQEILGKYYNLHTDLMNHWLSIFKEDIFILEHEKLIENQERVSKEIIKYCELQWENSCLEFYKTERQVQTASNEQVREPINKKSIAVWEKYEEFLQPLLKTLN